MGTDGSGYKDLIVERGASRDGFQHANKAKLFMNGSKIFMFTVGNIPQSIKKLLKISKIKKEKIYEYNPDSKVIRWRYVGEDSEKFGWPNYGRILKI